MAQESKKITVEVNEENIKKSLTILGIDLEKASTFMKKKEDSSKETDEENTDVDVDIDLEKEKAEKEKAEKEELEAKAKKEKEELEEKSKKAEKAVDEDLIKGIVEPIIQEQKSLNEKLDRILDLFPSIEKGLKDGFETSDKKFTALGEIEKGQFEVLSELKKGYEDKFNLLEGKVKKIERMPMPQKSLTSQASAIEKGFDNNLLNSSTQLSLTKNKKDLLGILEQKSGINGGVKNQRYMDALVTYETSSQMDKGIMDDLFKEDKIIITK